MSQVFIESLKQAAYSDLNVDNYKADLQGWMDRSFENVFKRFLTNFNQGNITVIEVGSWKGLSTSTMARICKESGKEADIIAVDTWLGAQEFWTWGRNDVTRQLQLVNGYPSVYYTFAKNMKVLGHMDTVAPLPLPSTIAADVLEYYKIKADIVYIDAAHDYENVKQDIATYTKLVRDGGIIFGDDYSSCWPGVQRAVNEAFPHRKIDGVVWSVVR